MNLLWLPYDESRLYAAAQHGPRRRLPLGARRRRPHARPARRAPRLRPTRSPRRWSRRGAGEVRRDAPACSPARAERTLTQGHLGQHLLFHDAAPDRDPRATRPRSSARTTQRDVPALRRAELSPLQICELYGRTRDRACRRGVASALTRRAARGVRTGSAEPAPGRGELDRQLRQVPRWLGQSRYNGPSGGGKNRPPAVAATSPSTRRISADGRWWCGTPTAPTSTTAEQLRRDPRRAAPTSSAAGASRVSPPGRVGSRRRARPTTPLLAADGSAVAFETAPTTFPLAKRVGRCPCCVRDLRTGKVDERHHGRPPGGRAVAHGVQPHHLGRRALRRLRGHRQRHGRHAGAQRAVGVRPRDGQAAPDHRRGARARRSCRSSPATARRSPSPRPTDSRGRTLVFLRPTGGGDLNAGLARRRPAGGAAADADAYEPALSRRRAPRSRSTTRARNMGAAGNRRDLRPRPAVGPTELVSGGCAGTPSQPALSADGRSVVFVARRRRPTALARACARASASSTAQTGSTTLVSRADGSARRRLRLRALDSRPTGARGVHLDRRRPHRRKPKGLAGVFACATCGPDKHADAQHAQAPRGPPGLPVAKIRRRAGRRAGAHRRRARRAAPRRPPPPAC